MLWQQVFCSWFLSSGFFWFLVLLLLSVFLAAQCSDCHRRSFELKDSGTEKNPSILISVVKLEEARENPMISQIQQDEREFCPDEGKQVPAFASRNHQGEPHSTTESGSEEEVPVPFIPWRSHLMDSLSRDVASSPDSAHIHSDIVVGRDQDKRRTPPTSPGHTPEEEGEEEPTPSLPGRRSEMEEGWTER